MHNSGTSGINQITWGQFIRFAEKYFTSVPFEQQFRQPSIHFTANKKVYAIRYFLKSKVPQKIYSALAKITFNTSMKKNASRLKKINQKGNMVNNLMAYFTCNDWIFDSPLYYKFIEFTADDVQNFDLDMTLIQWKHYSYLYCYGLQTYVMKQKGVPLPREDFDDVIAKRPNQTYFDDILWASSRGKLHLVRKQSDVMTVICNSRAVQDAMEKYISTPEFQKSNITFKEDEKIEIAQTLVKEYIEELSACMKKSVVKSAAWASHKVLKRMYDKITVDITDLRMIRTMQEECKNPILLVPTRKSYNDMILINYIFFANGLKQPFFSTPSQYRDVRLLNRIFKSCGSFYVQETNNKPLYQAVLDEYISILISDKQTICAAIEENREQSGMLIKPNPKVFNSVINSFLNGKAEDVDIIPVTINYDRVLEGETFPYELVGEEKVKESLTRFISSARYIGTPFGKVCVNFGKKISIRNFIEDMGVPLHKMQDITESTKLLINESLCSKVLDSLSKNSVIMSTGPVAAVLLEFRKGISTEIMLKQVEYIYEELEARNAHVSEDTQMNRGSNHAMTLLNEFVKKKRDVFEPFVSPKVDYKNILMLAYYKNTIVHVFLKEMMIGKSNF